MQWHRDDMIYSLLTRGGSALPMNAILTRCTRNNSVGHKSCKQLTATSQPLPCQEPVIWLFLSCSLKHGWLLVSDAITHAALPFSPCKKWPCHHLNLPHVGDGAVTHGMVGWALPARERALWSSSFSEG